MKALADNEIDPAPVPDAEYRRALQLYKRGDKPDTWLDMLECTVACRRLVLHHSDIAIGNLCAAAPCLLVCYVVFVLLKFFLPLFSPAYSCVCFAVEAPTGYDVDRRREPHSQHHQQERYAVSTRNVPSA